MAAYQQPESWKPQNRGEQILNNDMKKELYELSKTNFTLKPVPDYIEPAITELIHLYEGKLSHYATKGYITMAMLEVGLIILNHLDLLKAYRRELDRLITSPNTDEQEMTDLQNHTIPFHLKHCIPGKKTVYCKMDTIMQLEELAKHVRLDKNTINGIALTFAAREMLEDARKKNPDVVVNHTLNDSKINENCKHFERFIEKVRLMLKVQYLYTEEEEGKDNGTITYYWDFPALP